MSEIWRGYSEENWEIRIVDTYDYSKVHHTVDCFGFSRGDVVNIVSKMISHENIKPGHSIRIVPSNKPWEYGLKGDGR